MTVPPPAIAAGVRSRSLPVRLPLFAFAGCASILVAGVAASEPKLLLGALVALCVVTLAFRNPVANLTLFVFLTTVVPFHVLNRFSVGGGLNSPGLLLSDIFLLAGLAWAALAVPSLPLDRRHYLYSLAIVFFLAVVVIQTVHGFFDGYVRSTVGQEARVLLGFGTFLIALPLLAHGPSRRRLLGALTLVALALGGWGMLQWLGHYSFGAAGDVGVRAGVRLTSGGGGQLQGGEFAFPVAIIFCFAALTLAEIRSWLWRSLLLTALALNIASCLVTFERSFWLDAVAGVAFVLVFAPGGKRLKVLGAMTAAVVIGIGVVSAVSPQTLTTAQQRLNSIGAYQSDDSVRYRVVESRVVYERIRAHPLEGSGLGATIFWGQPWAKVPPKTRNYSHDGYLWLAWKVGLPTAALLVLLLILSLFGRNAFDEEPLSLATRRGAQGAILGLLVATITFPSFSQLSIAPVIGLLLALAISPSFRPRPERSRPAAQARAAALSR
ncbi:MAG TPA: O-antigen ligase family protein [Solirubrobacteraceae bacterium]|nr:O-antigen ligase family protein [Solirubrobacteraceae bacterium]